MNHSHQMSWNRRDGEQPARGVLQPLRAVSRPARAHWDTFPPRTPVFALGAARRAHWSSFVLRTPVFALGTARRAHAGLTLMAILLAATTAGCDAPSSSNTPAPPPAAGSAASSSSTFGPISSGSGTFRGMKGVVKVAGHVLTAKDGQLALDGTPYGTVEGNSESTLTVNDAEVKVQVDGIVRKPGSTTR